MDRGSTMTPFVAGLSGAALVGGALLAVLGLRPVTEDGKPSPRPRRRLGFVATILGDSLPEPARRRRRGLLSFASAGGLVVWLVTGWIVAVLILPLLVVGLP